MEMLAHNPQMAQDKSMTPTAAKEYVSHNTGSASYKNLPERSSPHQSKTGRTRFHRLTKYMK
jgi:hypothetical protein